MTFGLGIPGWLAVAGGGPSRLVTPLTPDVAVRMVEAEQAARAWSLSPWLAIVMIVVSLAMSAGLMAGALWWWRARHETPTEAAMRAMSARMGLRPEERALVRVLARERGVAEVGLLVSCDALREMLRGPRQGGEEAARVWLARRCG